jgi:hypothetical protein
MKHLIWTLAALGAASFAHAAPILVANHSFETTNALNAFCAGTGCAFNVAAIPDWTVVGNGQAGSFRPGTNATYFSFIPDGTIVGYSNGPEIRQTVAATAVAGTTYTLSVEVGNRFEQNQTGTIALMVGGMVIAGSTSAVPEGGWSTFTAVYTALAADAGAAITIRLFSTGSQANFDNVRLDGTAGGAIPEPASATLMIGAGAAFLLYRRRQR